MVHDFCVLLGFGADAVCPYLVFETMYRLRNLGLLDKELNDDLVRRLPLLELFTENVCTKW